MRIACLIKPSPPTIFFVNAIHRHSPVSLVVIEANRVGFPSLPVRLFDSYKKYGLMVTIDSYFDRLRTSRDPNLAHDEFFGDLWQGLDPEIPTLHVSNINDNVCVERLRQERLDLLLDHGTSIVKAPVLDTVPLALNLHWGLAPYYRGANCTEWALVNWDPFNIGVTIHKLAKKIDGGDILAQRRATVREDDDVHAINMQLTKLGTDQVLEILPRLETGESLTYHAQDFSEGFVTLSRQISRHWASHVRFMERHGVIKKMLKTPARATKLPIVELVANALS